MLRNLWGDADVSADGGIAMANGGTLRTGLRPEDVKGWSPGCHPIEGTNTTLMGDTSDGGPRQCPPGHVYLAETMNTECHTFELIVSLILVGLTCGMGLVGNILSILTLRRDTVGSVTTFLLTMLALADIAFILPAIVVILLPAYCEYFNHCVMPLMKVQPYIQQYGWAVASFAHSWTVYVTVLVAIHRYFYVCRPHDCHRLSGLARAKRQAYLIPVCSLLFNLPRIFEYQVSTIVHTVNNATQIETQKVLTDVGSSPVYQILYKNVLFYVLMYFIPLTTLITLSIKLAQALHKRRQNKYRGRSSQNHIIRRDDNITFVLIIIIAVFVVCQTPMLVQRLILAVSEQAYLLAHSCGHVYFYLEQTADYFAVLNSCVNFIIYVLFARRFRHTLMNDVLCKARQLPDRLDSSKSSARGQLEAKAPAEKPPRALISIRISKSKSKSSSHPGSNPESPAPGTGPGGLSVCNGNLCSASGNYLTSNGSQTLKAPQPASITMTTTSDLDISTIAEQEEDSKDASIMVDYLQHSEEAAEADPPPKQMAESGQGKEDMALRDLTPGLSHGSVGSYEGISDTELDSPSESLLQADSSIFHASV